MESHSTKARKLYIKENLRQLSGVIAGEDIDDHLCVKLI